jgi:phospholipase D1/2
MPASWWRHPVRRALARTHLRSQARRPGKNRADATGIFELDVNCCAVGRAGRAAFLIDGAAYYRAFMQAARKARHSIMIIGWDFDSRTALDVDDRSNPITQLGEFLNELARARRKLHIRVLEWDYPVIFGVDRELSPLYGLTWKPHRRVHFRFDDTHPLAGSHHQKIVVIDDRVAFVGGLDLTSKRWDTPAHRPQEPGRMFDGKPYPPMHDVMVCVDGEAAASLAETARARWQAATHEHLKPVYVRNDPWPDALEPDVTDAHFGLACTAPANNGSPAVGHVERLYLDMIARAQRYIYIENQYFTSQKIASALAARLIEPDGPEIVLVTRLLSHGWLEEVTMQLLRSRHIETLRRADAHGRFYACYPHVDCLCAGTCIDTHSKLMVVDDEWLRVGSANLSNRSMGVDTECDIVIQADGEPRVREGIRAFRNRLLAEHLGRDPARVQREIDSSGSIKATIARLGTAARTLAQLEVDPPSDAAMTAASLADMEKPVSMETLVQQLAPEPQPRSDASPRFPWVKVLLGMAVVAMLTATWRFTPLAQMFTPDNVIGFFETFARHWWAPLLIMAAYTPASIVMFPRPVITLAAVVSFGAWAGFALAMTGVLLASAIGYYAGRRFGRQTVRRLAGPRLNRLMQVLRSRGVIAITAVRLVPLAPFIVESMVAGAIHMKLWQLTLGTFLGMLPGTLMATILGDAIESALHDPSRINWGFVVTVAGLLALATYVVQRWLRKVAIEPHHDVMHPAQQDQARQLRIDGGA